MYDSLGDTETHVNSYPLTDIIQLDFKRTDQILLTSNTATKKGAQIQYNCPTFTR